MTAQTRPARATDADVLTTLLNDVITAGGTTAHQTTFDAARTLRHYIDPAQLISCTVAEVAGNVVGFQSLVWPDQDGQPFPEGWAIIATFVDIRAAGQGVGRALFIATKAAAKAANVQSIDATIRADNSVGLGYYGGMGFTDYDVLRSVPLRDGQRVDRIRKRFDL